jgi:hypothetical protein
MQLKRATPLTSVLSHKGRGSKLLCESESPFSEPNRLDTDSGISSPLVGEGRVRGVFNFIDAG